MFLGGATGESPQGVESGPSLKTIERISDPRTLLMYRFQ